MRPCSPNAWRRFRFVPGKDPHPAAWSRKTRQQEIANARNDGKTCLRCARLRIPPVPPRAVLPAKNWAIFPFPSLLRAPDESPAVPFELALPNREENKKHRRRISIARERA